MRPTGGSPPRHLVVMSGSLSRHLYDTCEGGDMGKKKKDKKDKKKKGKKKGGKKKKK